MKTSHFEFPVKSMFRTKLTEVCSKPSEETFARSNGIQSYVRGYFLIATMLSFFVALLSCGRADNDVTDNSATDHENSGSSVDETSVSSSTGSETENTSSADTTSWTEGPTPIFVVFPSDFQSAEVRTMLRIELGSPNLWTLMQLDTDRFSRSMTISTWPRMSNFARETIVSPIEQHPKSGYYTMHIDIVPTDTLPSVGWLGLYLDDILPPNVVLGRELNDERVISRWRGDSSPTLYAIYACEKGDGTTSLQLFVSEALIERSEDISLGFKSADVALECVSVPDSMIVQSCEGSIGSEPLTITSEDVLHAAAGGQILPFQIRLEPEDMKVDPRNAQCWTAWIEK